jgi:predicted nucleotidyltransferase component of viral defense system
MYTHRELREVFHFCFLERLLNISSADLYVLKGGVNLRFFLRSPRYSEDMDLDAIGGSVPTLKKNGYKVLNDAGFRRTLRTYGIADIAINDPEKAKHTESTQRFRVQLITESGERLPSKVEFSRRPNVGRTDDRDHAVTLDTVDSELARRYKRIAFRCRHYSGEAAVNQKIRALAGRAVTQARDVFDLEVLDRGGFAHAGRIRREIPTEILRSASVNLDALSFDDFNGQVVEYLVDEHQAEFATRKAWASMVETARRLVAS